MADLSVPLSSTSVNAGDPGHPGLHTEERDYLETMRQWQQSAGAAAVRRPMYLTVASADAPADFKAGADYVCDGTADQVQINAALLRAAPLSSRNALMPAQAQQVGKVLLSGGRFNCSAPIVARTGVHLSGSGWLTEVRADNNNGTGLITLGAPTDHIVMVSDMLLNGNWGSGGSCNGIDFDMTGSGSTSSYPSSSPDSYHHIHDLFVDGFEGGTRHGVNIWSGSTSNNRGNIIDRLQVRNISGDGIRLSSASDSFISNCHVGTVNGSGYRIATGNTKIANCKSFYCDTYGLYATSGRGTLTGFESQDDSTGIYLDAQPWSASALTVDTSSVAGLRLGASGMAVAGFTVFLRGSGRYATMGIGLHIDGSHTDMSLLGSVNPSNITTPISGTPGARSWMAVSNGSTLVRFGA